MDQNKHLELRYARLTIEAAMKSLLWGLVVALGVDFALGTVFWLIGIKSLALTIGLLCGILVAGTAAAGAIFYFAKFKPTVLTNAKRIDSLGLEERVITMIEYQNADSVITRLQREDAIRALDRVDEKTILFQFTRKLFVLLAIFGTLGLGMSTVASLSAAGLLPSGADLIEEALPDEPPIYIPVSYMAEDGGYIEGEMEQLVLLGENAEPVEAIPEEGYAFEGWDDGYKKPTRSDTEIDHPLVLVAIFLPIEDEEGDDGGEEGENGEEPGEQEGESGDQQDGQEGEEEGESPSDTGSGKYSKENQIIDGNTYYREFLEEYRDKIMELLKKSTEELTEEERAIIEAYINIV